MKLSKYAWVLWGIALAVVLALALIIPFVHNTIFWIGLGCTIAMFGVCALVFVRAFRRDESVQSKLLGWTLFRVGYMALVIQLIVGFALMGTAAFCPLMAAVIPEIFVFAFTAFSMTVKDAAREVVVSSETKTADFTAAWKAIRTRAASVAAESGHPDLKKLAEQIRYADPTPTSMDGDIAQMLETLSSYADAANIKKAFAMLEQRKTLAKQMKQ